MSQRINILLAAFNGEKYIAQQLDSILTQDYNNIKITVRDDASSDGTIDILSRYERNYPQLELHQSSANCASGHLNNFAELCELALHSQDDYFSFSDQDDRWHSNKLLIMHRRLLELEEKYGKETPILVHCDLKVVNDKLDEIAPSFVKYQGLPSPEEHDLPQFLFQNVVTGCATLFNRALLNTAAPIPNSVVVHDWWFALCAKMFGILDYVDTPLLDYRQHGLNAIGAVSCEEQSSYLKKYIYQALFRFPRHLSRSIRQAQALNRKITEDTLGENVCIERVTALNEFSCMKQLPVSDRLRWSSSAVNNQGGVLEKLYFCGAFFVVKWV